MRLPIPIPKGRRSILVLGIPVGLAAAGALVFTQLMAAAPIVKVPDPGPGQFGAMLALDTRVINLTPSTGGYKLAKVGVTIELRPDSAGFYDLHGAERTKAEKTITEKYTDVVPVLFDALGSVISAHTSGQLNTTDGRNEVKGELLEAVRGIIGEDEVLHVYFTDFVMQ
jgi:flagellar basal body-associated protein FliL